MTSIPTVGQWISTEHTCRIDTTRAAREDNIRQHRTPVMVTAVVQLGGGGNGDWRVETTRCDGSAMHLILNADGTERGEETGNTSNPTVDPPESAWCDVCDPVATPRHLASEHNRQPVSA